MLGDEQGVAFSEMSICEAHIEIGQLKLARRECNDAAQGFSLSKSNDVFKEVQVLLARIDLAEGDAHAALTRLNHVLDHGAADMPQRQVGTIYRVRARTYAAMGEYHAAFDDISEYLRRYTSENDLDRRLHAVAQRARFETDRQIERNTSLQHELKLSEENAARRTQQLRLTVIVIVVGLIGIALLIYVLLSNLRYRRVLIQLAEQDGLTGLPNRRQIIKLAEAALKAAASAGRPVTIGLLDLDHFKSINDRSGHAVGDRVLKEFSELGRGLLRAGDFLGRWGGEEFLLVLPDTALDAAVDATDRLRAATLLIDLPESAGDLQCRSCDRPWLPFSRSDHWLRRHGTLSGEESRAGRGAYRSGKLSIRCDRRSNGFATPRCGYRCVGVDPTPCGPTVFSHTVRSNPVSPRAPNYRRGVRALQSRPANRAS
jgi:diguanylate cyclase (GGDEF)-like protein